MSSATSQACLTSDKPAPPCSAKGTGRSACQEVHKKANVLQSLMGDLTTIADPIGSIIKAVKGNSDSSQSTEQTITDNEIISTVTNQRSVCQQSADSEEINQITSGDGDKCFEELREGGLSKREAMGAMKIRNVMQSNQSVVKQTCGIKQTLGSLSKLSSSVENTALQRAINKASGMLSAAKSSQDSCEDINVDISACQYLQQTQCCVQSANDKQINKIVAACGSSVQDVVESNVKNTFQSCHAIAKTAIAQDVAQKLQNAAKQRVKNKASSDVVLIVAMFLVVGLVLFCVLPHFV